MSAASSPVRIIPLGGLSEIGMNCMLIEYADEILIIDCGLMFSDLDHLGVEFIIPDFKYLIANKDRVAGILVTHGHEDHIGAIPFLLKAGIHAPIFASPFSTLLLKERLKEYSLDATTDIRTFLPGDAPIQFKNFKVQTVSVNHSIIDAAALFIDTPAGRIIHTGDFKIDPTPFYGSMIDLDKFAKAGDEGVLLLLSDSTNVERCEHSLSENKIYQKFEELFAAAEGMIVVSMFASNVARMGQMIQLAAKAGKKVALAGRSMITNADLSQQLGYLKEARSTLISMDDIGNHSRKEVIILSTGSQGEHRSALIRMSMGEHSHVKLQKGDRVLMSSKFIPGNEKAIGRMINNLFRQGADVFYEAIHELHSSGHATKPELEKILKLTKPKYFIPIHGEYRHLVHHSMLAKEVGIPPENVSIVVNHDVVELTPNSCKIVEHLEDNRIFVEGRDGADVSKLVLKDRKQLGEKGVVFTLMVRSAESRKILSEPEVLARGLVNEQFEGWILEECKAIVKKLIVEYETGIINGEPEMDLQEVVRIQLRRFLNQNIGKKPVVLPIILDL